jgi:hypothetical protein
LRNEALIGVWQWVKRGAETGTKGRDVRMGMAVHGGLRTFSATAAQLQVDAGSRHPLFSEITRFSALPQGSFEPFSEFDFLALCARSVKKCRVSENYDAAMQRKERSFMQAAARITCQIHKSRTPCDGKATGQEVGANWIFVHDLGATRRFERHLAPTTYGNFRETRPAAREIGGFYRRSSWK